MTTISEINTLALRWSCSYCGVGTEEWCVTHHWQDRQHLSPPTGLSVYLHGARTKPLLDLEYAGYVDGHRAGQVRAHVQVARLLDARSAYNGGELSTWLLKRSDAINEGVIN